VRSPRFLTKLFVGSAAICRTRFSPMPGSRAQFARSSCLREVSRGVMVAPQGTRASAGERVARCRRADDPPRSTAHHVTATSLHVTATSLHGTGHSGPWLYALARWGRASHIAAADDPRHGHSTATAIHISCTARPTSVDTEHHGSATSAPAQWSRGRQPRLSGAEREPLPEAHCAPDSERGSERLVSEPRHRARSRVANGHCHHLLTSGHRASSRSLVNRLLRTLLPYP